MSSRTPACVWGGAEGSQQGGGGAEGFLQGGGGAEGFPRGGRGRGGVPSGALLEDGFASPCLIYRRIQSRACVRGKLAEIKLIALVPTRG